MRFELLSQSHFIVLIVSALSRSLDFLECHKANGKGIFKAVPLGFYRVVSTYYAKLVYDNQSVGAPRHQAVYGEGALLVRVKTFVTWDMILKLNTSTRRSRWLLP